MELRFDLGGHGRARPEMSYPLAHLMGRFISFVFTLGCLGFFAMVYDNVYTDISPIRALADVAVCGVQNCKKHHANTQVERTWSGQSFAYRWDNAVVNVDCKRAHFAIGERQCTAK